MASAEDLGKKLLAEVEEVGLDEVRTILILQTLRLQDEGSAKETFNFEPLDRLIQGLLTARPQAFRTNVTAPIVELMSLHPGAGKTHLLYYICAKAVLPTNLSGSQACVIILDTDGHFSVPKLASQMEYLLRMKDTSAVAQKTDEDILTALAHVHIFRPQTLVSTIATLDTLLAYLFNKDRHSSFDRPVAFIALDSASAFYWQDRAETEDATFLASTSSPSSKPQPPPCAYSALAASLKVACKALDCPAIVASWYLGSSLTQFQQRAYRSSFPAAFAALPTLRLVVQRVPVRKFPAHIAVEEARREASDRQNAVDEGKYMCFVNETGWDERTVQRLASNPSGSGFGFRIMAGTVILEEP